MFLNERDKAYIKNYSKEKAFSERSENLSLERRNGRKR